MNENEKRKDSGVLVIYTGGTIGSLPKDRKDPLSPLEPAPIDEVLKWLPAYDDFDHKITIHGDRIRVGTVSFKPPLDSSNIQPKNWVEMAELIQKHYNDYEGFVLLHGTDTLAYTSSALSFMLENLSKPVVITGSQRPIGEPRSDAVQNLVTAIEIAAARTLKTTVVPEVCVFFRDTLTRGCRTTKLSANSYYAFDSPNLKPLATAGEHIAYDKTIIREPAGQNLHIKTKLEPSVASFDIFPGMKPELLDKMLNYPELQGAVLQTFGTGNAPSTEKFLAPIGKAVESDTLLLNVTQCRQGEVEQGLYDVSAGLLARGVVSGMDMTPDAALTKMFIVLGEEQDKAIAADLMQLNMRGEQRHSVFMLHFPAGGFDEEGRQAQALTPLRPMVVGNKRFEPQKVEKALLRISGLTLPDYKRGIIQLRFFLDAAGVEEGTPTAKNRHFLGEATKKWKEGEEQSFVIPITEQVRTFVDNSHENTLTLVNSGGGPVTWEQLHVAIFADC